MLGGRQDRCHDGFRGHCGGWLDARLWRSDCDHEDTCIVGAVLRMTEFYRDESCGKCTPCREGTYWLTEILHRLEHGQGKQKDIDLLLDICDNSLASRSARLVMPRPARLSAASSCSARNLRSTCAWAGVRFGSEPVKWEKDADCHRFLRGSA